MLLSMDRPEIPLFVEEPAAGSNGSRALARSQAVLIRACGRMLDELRKPGLGDLQRRQVHVILNSSNRLADRYGQFEMASAGFALVCALKNVERYAGVFRPEIIDAQISLEVTQKEIEKQNQMRDMEEYEERLGAEGAFSGI
jgi:hypothetical protein